MCFRPGGGNVIGGWAEYAGIVGPGAAVALKLVGVAPQRVGLAQIAENAAVGDAVNDWQRLVRSFAKAVEGGAQIIARQQIRGRPLDQIADCLGPFGGLGRVCLDSVEDPG